MNRFLCRTLPLLTGKILPSLAVMTLALSGLAQAQMLDVDPILQKKPGKPAVVKPAASANPAPDAKTEDEDSSPVTLPSSSSGKPFTASISKSLYLPPEMYGQWSVSFRLVDTNAPPGVSINQTGHDVWVLERYDDVVTITNPANGASASVSVDAVAGNRATFHHIITGRNRVFIETPTVTVFGDTMRGVTIHQIQKVKNNQVVSSYYIKFELEATRLSPGRTRFRPDQLDQEPDLEIEDVVRINPLKR